VRHDPGRLWAVEEDASDTRARSAPSRPHNYGVIPQTRYLRLDGLRLAYQVLGEGPPDIVLSAGSFNHTEAVWEEPAAAVFLDRLASFSRLIRFDPFGVGGSDRPPAHDAGPGFLTQLEALLDEVGVDRVALVAGLDAAFAMIEFATKHPDRVTHLVLYNATARFRRADDYEMGVDDDALEALLPLLEDGWGTEPMARLSVPSRAEDPRFMAWYLKYMRAVGTPTDVSRNFAVTKDFDVRHLLPRIAAPTLVLHKRDYALVPRAQGEYLAAHIPGAQYIELAGSDGPLYWEDPDGVLRIIERFIRGADPGARPSRTMAALLFTDIAASTRRAHSVGDRDWVAILGHHDDISATVAAAHRGRVVQHTGDGVLAVFPNPSDALAAARALRARLASMSIDIRSGVHAGEVEQRDDGVSGLAVHIAARVMAQAEAGEILVSRTVRDLVIGSGEGFSDAGIHDLKGIDEPWHLYRVEV
jgi:class 3 adenylate cyclase/pimeloyl-ACP methyl ester carboxylesterase